MRRVKLSDVVDVLITVKPTTKTRARAKVVDDIKLLAEVLTPEERRALLRALEHEA